MNKRDIAVSVVSAKVRVRQRYIEWRERFEKVNNGDNLQSVTGRESTGVVQKVRNSGINPVHG